MFDLFFTTSALRCFRVSSERLALLRGKPVEKASGPGKPVVGAVEMDHDFLNCRGSNVDGWFSGLWFQICFIFTPKSGEDEPTLTCIFFTRVGSTTNQLCIQLLYAWSP